MTTKEQKSYNRRDRTLIFVDGDDELDFEVEEFQSPRAAMSCGHAVTPMSLTKYCRWLLDKGDCTFVCPLRKDPNTDCDAKWPYTEVRKMALLTPEEMKHFELTVARNAARKYSEIKSCPGCKSSVVRKTPSDLSVHCTVCTVNRKKKYLFCWQCLRKWKGPAPRSDRCDNDDCSNAQLDLLRACKEIIFEEITDVSGCPSVRACPTCGHTFEHNKTGCKNITCTRCKVEFCFVCLKCTNECLKTSKDDYGPCSSGVAPRQTSIPVWRKK